MKGPNPVDEQNTASYDNSHSEIHPDGRMP